MSLLRSNCSYIGGAVLYYSTLAPCDVSTMTDGSNKEQTVPSLRNKSRESTRHRIFGFGRRGTGAARTQQRTLNNKIDFNCYSSRYKYFEFSSRELISVQNNTVDPTLLCPLHRLPPLQRASASVSSFSY